MSYVKGAGTFARRAAQAAKAVDLAVEEANRQAALIIQEEVVARCPVKTGKLRARSRPERSSQSWKFKGGYVFGLVTAELKGDGWYARFVEYGTKGYSAG